MAKKHIHIAVTVTAFLTAALIAAYLLVTPLSRLVHTRFDMLIDGYKNRFGLEIEYKKATINLFSSIVLDEVTLMSSSISRMDAIRFKQIAVSYSLTELLGRSREAQPEIVITLSGISGTVTDTVIETLLEASGSSAPSNREGESRILQTIVENLSSSRVFVALLEANPEIAVGKLQCTLDAFSAHVLIDSGELQKVYDITGNLSGSTFISSGETAAPLTFAASVTKGELIKNIQGYAVNTLLAGVALSTENDLTGSLFSEAMQASLQLSATAEVSSGLISAETLSLVARFTAVDIAAEVSSFSANLAAAGFRDAQVLSIILADSKAEITSENLNRLLSTYVEQITLKRTGSLSSLFSAGKLPEFSLQATGTRLETAPAEGPTDLGLMVPESTLTFFNNPTKKSYNILVKSDKSTAFGFPDAVTRLLSETITMEDSSLLFEYRNAASFSISASSEAISGTVGYLSDPGRFTLGTNNLLFQLKDGGLTAEYGTVLDLFVGNSVIKNLSAPLQVDISFDRESGELQTDLSMHEFQVNGEQYQTGFTTQADMYRGDTTINGTVVKDTGDFRATYQYDITSGTLDTVVELLDFLPANYLPAVDRFGVSDLGMTDTLSHFIIDGTITAHMRNFALDDTSRFSAALQLADYHHSHKDGTFLESINEITATLTAGSGTVAIDELLVVADDFSSRTTGWIAAQNGFAALVENENPLEQLSYDLLNDIELTGIDLTLLIGSEEEQELSLMARGNSVYDGVFTLTVPESPDIAFEAAYRLDPNLESATCSGDLTYGDLSLPLALLIDFPGRVLSLNSSDASIGVFTVIIDLPAESSNPIQGSFMAEDMSLQAFTAIWKEFPNLSGEGEFTVTDRTEWAVYLETVTLQQISYNNRILQAAVSNASISPSSITIGELTLTDAVDRLSGSVELQYDINDLSAFTGSVTLSNQLERVALSVAREASNVAITADISNLNLLHLPFDIGRGVVDGRAEIRGEITDFQVSSNLQIREGELSGEQYSGIMEVAADKERIEIRNFNGYYAGNSVTDFSLEYNYRTGTVFSSSYGDFSTEGGDLTFNLDLSTDIAPIDSILDLSVRRLLASDLEIHAEFSDIALGGEALLDLFTATIWKRGSTFSLLGGPEDSIALTLKPDGVLTAEIGKVSDNPLPISFLLTGTLQSGNIDAVLDEIEFNLTSLNVMFQNPRYLQFTSGDVYGTLQVTGTLTDPDFYGEMFCDVATGRSDLLPDEIVAEHVTASISEKSLYVLPFYARTSGNFVKVKVESEIEYVIPRMYHVTLTIPRNATQPISENFQMIGMEYDGRVSGRVDFIGNRLDLLIQGDLDLTDAVISMSPEGRVLNQNYRMMVSADLRLTTGKNVTAVLPTLDLPIITATVAEEQNLSVDYNARNRNYTVVGNLEILGGEILYFQRSFFITDGLLKINENQASRFDPLITLDAKLRDFDRNGEKIDIFLDINNDPVSSFTPILSSKPSRPLEDIAAILGSNIVPTTGGSSGTTSSAVAFASLASDVIQQLGILDIDPISDFEHVVRNAFQLDLFSIRTQVFQNFILDTLAVSNTQLLSINPIARYLDNTTVFLGKYINNDLFLQAMLHLTANDRYGPGLFMTDDLKLDVEVSVEWDNPLYDLRLSTQPEGLQPYQLFDALTIGVSWSFSF